MKFDEFTLKASISANDFLVGYTADGTDNWRMPKSGLSITSSQISNFNTSVDARITRIPTYAYFYTDTGNSYLGGPQSSSGRDIVLNATTSGILSVGTAGNENNVLDWAVDQVTIKGTVLQKFPTSAFTDDVFEPSQGQFYLNETTNRIVAKIKRSNSTVLNFTGLISLADANISGGYPSLSTNKLIYTNAEGSGMAVDAVTTPRYAFMKASGLGGVMSRINGQEYAVGRTSDSDVRNTASGNFTKDLVIDGSGITTISSLIAGLPTSAASLTVNNTYTFFESSGVTTLRKRISGSNVDIALGGSSPFDPRLLNMGSPMDATQKGNFVTTGGESVIVHYDASATSSSKIYAWANAAGAYQLQRRNDDASSSSGIFTVLPNSSTLGDMNIYIGGKKFYVPNQIAIGNGGITITDTILGVSGVHSVLNYSSATSGSRVYDWFLNASGELNLNRINDAGDTVTDTAMKITPITSSTSRLNVSGSIVAGDSLRGTNLYLSNNDSAWIEINNSAAGTDLKGWRYRSVNDGSLLISAISDNSANATTAIQITRTASGGTPTVTGIYKFNNTAVWDVTSDISTKIEDTIKPVDAHYSLDIITKLCVATFQHTPEYAKRMKWKDNSKIFIGTIAQWLLEICPEAVIEDEKGELSINISPLLWHSMNSIKALTARIEKLETLH
jgi:hypothetical protein